MKVFLAAALSLIVATTAGAQSVNIDFSHTNPNPTAAPSNSFAGAAGQPGYWMNVPTAINAIQIDGLDALPSGITLTRTLGNVSTFSVNNANTTGDFEALIDDFHGFSSVTTVNYQFTGVDPGPYTLYTYAIAPDNASFRTVVNVLTSTSINPQVVGGAMPVNSFIPGVTHAAHDIFVGPDGIINVTLTGNGTAGSINGFQLRQGDADLNAVIHVPAAFGCGCSPVTFMGTANGPGGIQGYTLEYASSSAGPWTEFDSGDSAIINDELGVWNANFNPEGNYLIRMTVTGLDGTIIVAHSAFFLDRQPPIASFSNVAANAVLGGSITLQGTAFDPCFGSYALQSKPFNTGAFTPVDPAHFTYPQPAQASTLGLWNTTNTADGTYELRVAATDDCGVQTSNTILVTVDNTPPAAIIMQPSGAFDLCGFVNVSGTASDANLDHWSLEYASAAASTWTTIASGTSNTNGTLLSWNTTGLPRGAYTLRLTVVDRATDLTPGGLNGRTSTFLRTVHIGRGADINNDGTVNSADLSVLLGNFGATCF